MLDALHDPAADGGVLEALEGLHVGAIVSANGVEDVKGIHTNYSLTALKKG
jgi:hypothetical protein